LTAKVVYEGGLLTEATHIQSGAVIQTDAPVDNGGLGSNFSPTDLVAAALASCMCTIMALSAQKRSMQLGRIECDVDKIMVSNPRRIGEIKITMIVHGPNDYTDHERSILERAALTCPVYESLHPDLVKTVLFIWP
jgi:putative redox protein